MLLVLLAWRAGQDGSTTMHSRPPAVAAASIALGEGVQRKRTRPNGFDVQEPCARQIDETHERILRVHELPEDLEIVQHHLEIGDRERDPHAAHQHKPPAAAQALERRERCVGILRAADHVEGHCAPPPAAARSALASASTSPESATVATREPPSCASASSAALFRPAATTRPAPSASERSTAALPYAPVAPVTTIVSPAARRPRKRPP